MNCLSRRKFLALSSAGLASVWMSSKVYAQTKQSAAIQAVLFDGFAIWDPRPINALAEEIFPGKGDLFIKALRVRQFDYQWLRVLMGKYADFWQVTNDALVVTAEQMKLDMTSDKLETLMQAHLQLKAWPDTIPALQQLKDMEIKLAPLSNLNAKMLEENIKSSGMNGLFDKVLSTDLIKSYKPDPRAYQLGMEAYSARREQLLFIPSAGWDAAGAKSFGYPTFWNNRQNNPEEQLGVKVDGSSPSLMAMVEFVKMRNQGSV